jgi:hypothetical protein
VATWVHRTTTQPTGWASGTNKVISNGDKCCDLRARKTESGSRRIESEIFIERFVGKIVRVGCFFRNDHESVVVFFVRNGEPANRPLHVERRTR